MTELITEAKFLERMGRKPELDDMERSNCIHAGDFGHMWCGWCNDCEKPRFICGHPAPPTGLAPKLE